MVPLEGPVSVGAFVDAVMLGGAIVQSCVYYKNSRVGAGLWNILVSLILFLLLSHLGCTTAWLWANWQASAEDSSMADYASVFFGISNVFSAMILFFERCFFSYRIKEVSNNHLLAFVSFVFCIFSLTAALGAASIFFANTTADLTDQLSGSWVFPLLIISGLVCDLAISITSALCLRFQTQSESVSVMGRATRLLCLIAETGCVTSLFDVTVVLVYWSTKSNLAWVGLLVSMPGLFANAFLAALNARRRFCVDIQHQRIPGISDKLIDERPKKPPIMITISKQVEKHSEKSPVWV